MFSSRLITISALVIVAVASSVAVSGDAKLLRRSRYYGDGPMDGYDSPYASGSTGERAIITVRGARNPYDGSAPNKLIIEDQPYTRGPYPRGVYDRLEPGYNRPMSPLSEAYSGYSGYSGGYGGYGGYGRG